MTVDTQKLVRMAEQVAANLDFDDDKDALAGRVANHLERFWDPRMKSAIKAYSRDNEEQLSEIIKAAVARLPD